MRVVRLLIGIPSGVAFVLGWMVGTLRRPGVQLGVHGLAMLAVLGAAVWAGLYVVPAKGQTLTGSSPSGSPPSTSGAVTAAPGGEAPAARPSDALGGKPGKTPERKLERPQDALSGWAGNLEGMGIPKVALQAYGYAELALAEQQPGCHLSWSTLAGIGRVESNHGRSHDAKLLDDGRSDPPVVGLPLDGGPERKEIRDTDNGELDGDTTYDRAVGPMQFIPTTWERWATDGDRDGRADPFDIDDAAVAAGRYLCAGGRDMATGEGWRSGILSYNHMDVYVRDVFTAADEYGRRSRQGS